MIQWGKVSLSSGHETTLTITSGYTSTDSFMLFVTGIKSSTGRADCWGYPGKNVASNQIYLFNNNTSCSGVFWYTIGY